jgi:hypothetical protein
VLIELSQPSRSGAILTSGERFVYGGPMRRLSSAAVAFAVITMTGAGLGDTAASAKPRQPNCRHFFTHSQIVSAVGGSAAITSLQEARASAIYGSEIPTGTNCGYLWDTSTDPPVGDPMYSCSPDSLGRYANYSPGYGWIVAYDYTSKQWKRLKHIQKTSAVAPDPNHDQAQESHSIKLGHKSQAFYIYDKDYCNPDGTSGAYALYVRTHRHDLLTINLWPATLAAEQGLAEYVLVHDSKFF